MPAPTLSYANVHTLAHALSEAIPDLGAPANLALRPYNRFSTAFTTWWLIPSRTDWPAYHLSKLCLFPFMDSSVPSLELLAGIEFEKGLAPSIADLPEVDPSHIMRQDWRWKSLASPSFKSNLLKCAQHALGASQESLFAMVDAYAFNRVPDPEKPAVIPDDSGLWLIKGQGLELVPDSPPSTELTFLSSTPDLRSLVDRLFNHRPLDFFWVELRLGHRVRLSPEGHPQLNWAVRDLWLIAMKPWLELLG